MTRSAAAGRPAVARPIRARMSAWWAGTGVRRSGSESTTWTWQPRLARCRAATMPPPPLPPGPARTVTEVGEKRVIASSARLRPAFSIIWTSSMCRSSTMARSTARICSVVSAGTALRLTVRIGFPFRCSARPAEVHDLHLDRDVVSGFGVARLPRGLRLHALPAVERHSGEVHPPWLRAVREGSLQGTGVGLAVLRPGVDLLRPFQVRDGRVERGWICRGVMADDDGLVTRYFFQGLEDGDPVVEVSCQGERMVSGRERQVECEHDLLLGQQGHELNVGLSVGVLPEFQACAVEGLRADGDGA